jgi:hypothetical protein
MSAISANKWQGFFLAAAISPILRLISAICAIWDKAVSDSGANSAIFLAVGLVGAIRGECSSGFQITITRWPDHPIVPSSRGLRPPGTSFVILS